MATTPQHALDISPRLRLVFLTLCRSERRLSTDELAIRTWMNYDSLRHALKELVDAGLIERDVHPDDGRRRVYTVADSVPTPQEHATND